MSLHSGAEEAGRSRMSVGDRNRRETMQSLVLAEPWGRLCDLGEVALPL